ncbi:hypothetical protein J8I26_04670 [Herbaspirillum sp. LeCh32-8]|uniref:hypothetical protein n=1 Tax=Herbaspirillum sp. LeCh32-8 TaxID=2821356 RepID=UPI001AEAF71C|nr:hypothetical protein [Herbaspirillum sp. LeCh32-8]MBP0597385.1 hypothetical protein [Herbaspirillum sp. LeCh32-8]
MTTTNYQTVRVKKIGNDVEEEVVLESDGHELVCFASNRPASLEVSKTYPVALTLLVMDDYDITVLENDGNQSLERLDDSFAYRVVGSLIDGRLRCCGFEFKDEALETEFAYLNGQTVVMRVDRINVKFLKSSSGC